ncbi:unnamed protein product [Symbiodinium pilosum]|uniref:Uncharacterized protein n=1 Tax=Symbiodinium pilosum TaxID=2952 RepID=A0A812P237_SYMPI|nr:unnamed protein product [Symbiodinium pilosum]
MDYQVADCKLPGNRGLNIWVQRRRFGPETVPEKPPPPGDRIRKLELSGCELLAHEERLLVFWTKQLQSELCASDAPVLQKLEDSLDPARALEMLAGKTRAGTLKRYVVVYQRWRLWLQEAKLLHPPGRPIDLVDYLLTRRDEPCGRSVPAIKPIELRLEEGRLFTILRRTKTSGPNRRIKGLPVCVSEVAFYEDARWISVGFNLLKENASYKRDYLLPRLTMDRKMASYADAVVATAAVLARIGIPTAVQGYWTEHSERSILPTALAILGVTDSEKDILGRWKPEGSDTYVRSHGGRVARLQSRYAAAAREDSHYSVLDEREIAANLLDWLQDRRKLGEEASKAIVDPLVHMWKTGRIFADLVPVIPEVEDNPPEEKGEDSEDSQGPEPASFSKEQFFGYIELVPMVVGWGERGNLRFLQYAG